MTVSLEELRREYEAKASLYECLCREMSTQIAELIQTAGIALASPIVHRVKSWSSTADKVERGEVHPRALGDIRDVAGIRLIALFRRDIEPLTKIIEHNFRVLHKEDTAHRLGENQFGYGSVHYAVSSPETWLTVPTLKKLGGLCAEIQVRTASQHVWAAVSHILQYKKEEHVPLPLRRSISRVAALLETVDLEFDRVMSERDSYVEEIKAVEKDVPLNTESLRRVLDEFFPAKNKAEAEEYADLLDDLAEFKVGTTEQLRALIRKHWPAVEENEKIQLARASARLAKANNHLVPVRTARGPAFTSLTLGSVG